MRTAKRMLLAISLVTVAGVVACSVGGWLYPEHASRRSRAEAEDLVKKGWIPSCASETASDFSVRYSIDTGEIWGIFRFSGTAFDCPSSVVASPPAHPRPAGTKWWPPDPFPAATNTILSFSEDRLFYAVVDSSGGQAYFWKLGSLSRPIGKTTP